MERTYVSPPFFISLLLTASKLVDYSLAYILIVWCEVRVKGIIIQGVQESVITLDCHGFIETQLRKEKKVQNMNGMVVKNRGLNVCDVIHCYQLPPEASLSELLWSSLSIYFFFFRRFLFPSPPFFFLLGPD